MCSFVLKFIYFKLAFEGHVVPNLHLVSILQLTRKSSGLNVRTRDTLLWSWLASMKVFLSCHINLRRVFSDVSHFGRSSVQSYESFKIVALYFEFPLRI